jgi:hypothetical protein
MTLNRNKFIYNFLTEDIVKSIDISDEKLLHKISETAKFAWFNFPGILSDYRLENLINKIAKDNLKFNNRIYQSQNTIKSVLHIATTFHNTGGHTRVARNWIDVDHERNHYLLLTNQIDWDESLTKFFKNVCDVKVLSKDEAYLKKAQQILNFIAENNIDLIVLHHHPNDLAPVLACSLDKLPPVALYNHADHVFGLGVSVADICIDFSPLRMQCSLEKRMARNAFLLSYPIKQPEHISRANARAKLKIEEDEIMFFSMGSAYKYRTFSGIDFFQFYSAFILKHKNIKMYIAGVNEKKIQAKTSIPENLVLLGRIINPEEYLAAADYYIESFPMGGGLSTFDAAIHGAFPIFNFYSANIYGSGSIDMFSDKVKEKFTRSVVDYEELLKKEVKTQQLKKNLAEEVHKSVELCFPHKWKPELYKLYNEISRERHKIGMKQEKRLILNKYAFLFAEFLSNNFSTVIEIVRSADPKISILNRIIILYYFFIEKARKRNLKGTYSLVGFLVKSKF